MDVGQCLIYFANCQFSPDYMITIFKCSTCTKKNVRKWLLCSVYLRHLHFTRIFVDETFKGLRQDSGMRKLIVCKFFPYLVKS